MAEDVVIEITPPPLVEVTLSTGATGPPGTTLHAALSDTDTDGHPASAITGLGNAALLDVGSTAGTVAAGDHAHTGVYDPAGTAAAAVSAHAAASDPHGDRAYALGLVDDLSGVTNAVTARTNLGLGTLATLSAVGSAQITDGSIVAGDLSASAAVALSQLATQATGTFVGNVSGSTAVPSAVSAANTLAALSGVAAAAFSFNAQDVTAGRLGVNASAWSTVEKLRVNTPTTADTAANVMLAASATTARPLVLQGASSQSGYLTAWQNSAGSVRAFMNASGDLTLSSAVTIDSKKAMESVSPTSTLRIGEGYTYGQIKPVLRPYSDSASAVPVTAQGASGQTANLTEWQNSSAAVLASITAAGLHKWSSGNEQTTVGAAGAASALPATPTKFLKVVDSAGTTLVIPAYAAA